MLDLIQLLPHCKKDAKLDTKTDKGIINEVADMKVCKAAIIKPLPICSAMAEYWQMRQQMQAVEMTTLSVHAGVREMSRSLRQGRSKDLYLWLAKAPEGPSVKFLALNGE